MDYREDSPEILLDFLSYHETIKAHSQRTVDEYYLDLRNFFRYHEVDPGSGPLRGAAHGVAMDVRDVDLDLRGLRDPDGNLRLHVLPQPGPGAVHRNSDRNPPLGTEPHLPGSGSWPPSAPFMGICATRSTNWTATR